MRQKCVSIVKSPGSEQHINVFSMVGTDQHKDVKVGIVFTED